MSTKDKVTSALVMFPGSLIEEIREYKEENKIHTRNEAIRTLIKRGLEDTPK